MLLEIAVILAFATIFVLSVGLVRQLEFLRRTAITSIKSLRPSAENPEENIPIVKLIAGLRNQSTRATPAKISSTASKVKKKARAKPRKLGRRGG